MAGRGRDAPIGGAGVAAGGVIGGVPAWSVAVRAPTDAQLESPQREVPAGAIAVRTFPFSSAMRRHRLLRLPLVRGVVALGGSLAIGMRALNISANTQVGSAEGGEQLSGVAWAGAVALSFAFAIGLF